MVNKFKHAVDSSRLDLEKQIMRQQEFYNKHVNVLSSVLDDLEKLKPEFGFSGSFDIRLIGTKHALTEALRIFAKHGIRRQSVEPVQEGATAFSGFLYGENDLSIWFAFSSTSCRRVKVGTKTVEQDVYETVCDETVIELASNSTAERQPEFADDLPF